MQCKTIAAVQLKIHHWFFHRWSPFYLKEFGSSARAGGAGRLQLGGGGLQRRKNTASAFNLILQSLEFDQLRWCLAEFKLIIQGDNDTFYILHLCKRFRGPWVCCKILKNDFLRPNLLKVLISRSLTRHFHLFIHCKRMQIISCGVPVRKSQWSHFKNRLHCLSISPMNVHQQAVACHHLCISQLKPWSRQYCPLVRRKDSFVLMEW